MRHRHSPTLRVRTCDPIGEVIDVEPGLGINVILKIVSYMEPLHPEKASLPLLVSRFMRELHRYDAGRTLPLMHVAKLTTPQLAVLEFVRVSRTVSAVAVHVGLSRPATSQMINKLVDRRLVRRSEGVVDRREKSVTTSAKGIALLERISAARLARFEASLTILSPRVAARLMGALQETVAALARAHASSPGSSARSH
jgi:DNA-binding MarR family transcriptional regulator